MASTKQLIWHSFADNFFSTPESLLALVEQVIWLAESGVGTPLDCHFRQ